GRHGRGALHPGGSGAAAQVGRPVPARLRRRLLVGGAGRHLRQAALGLGGAAAVLLAAGPARRRPALGCVPQLPGGSDEPAPRAAAGGARAGAARRAGDRSVTSPGRFIVFEGLDGAGTTTQAKLLAERLNKQGRTVYLAHQPSEGPVGLLIRQILAGRAATPQADGKLAVVDERVMALLFAADRLDHLGSQIEPRLARGGGVILERYTLSSRADQGGGISPRFLTH